MSHNLFESLQQFTYGGKTGQYYSLPALEKAGLGKVSRLIVERPHRALQDRLVGNDVVRTAGFDPRDCHDHGVERPDITGGNALKSDDDMACDKYGVDAGMGHRGAQRITSGVTEIDGALHQGLLLSLAKREAGANKAVSVTKNGSQTIRTVVRGQT